MTPEFAAGERVPAPAGELPDGPADDDASPLDPPSADVLLTHMYSCALPGRGSTCDCGAQ